MPRAAKRLTQCSDSILKRPQAQLHISLGSLARLASDYTSFVIDSCRAHGVFSKESYNSLPKGTWQKVARCLVFARECVSLCKRAIQGPLSNFKGLDWNLHAHIVACMSTILNSQIVLNIDFGRKILQLQSGLLVGEAELLSTLKDVIGFKPALGTLEVYIKYIQAMPNGILNNALTLAPLAFLTAWQHVMHLSIESQTYEKYMGALKKLGAAGIAVYVDAFCKVIDDIYTDDTSHHGSLFKDFDGALDIDVSRKCANPCFKFAAMKTWDAISKVAKAESDIEGDLVFMVEYLAVPEVQEKMLQAVHRLQEYLVKANWDGVSVGGQDAVGDHLGLHLGVLKAAEACYKVGVSRYAMRGTAPLQAIAMRAKRWLLVGCRALSESIRGLQAAMAFGEYSHREDIWKLVNTASWVFVEANIKAAPFTSLFKGADAESSQRRDTSTASPGTNNSVSSRCNVADVEGFLNHVSGLAEVTISSAGLLVAQPRLWTNALNKKSSLNGRMIVMSHVMASNLILDMETPLETYLENTKKIDEQRASLQVVAVSAADLAIKAQLVLSLVPDEIITALLKCPLFAFSEGGPAEVQDRVWVDMISLVVDSILNISFKILEIESPGCSDSTNLLATGLSLSSFRANFLNKGGFASKVSLLYKWQHIDALIHRLNLVVAAGGSPFLLPSELAVLESLWEKLTIVSDQGPIFYPNPNHTMGPKEIEGARIDAQFIGFSPNARAKCLSAKRGLERLVAAHQGCEDKARIQEIRIRRSRAFKKLLCCNPECVSIVQRPENGQKVPRQLCSGCLAAHYCCRKCQKADWKEHKKVCSALNDMRKNNK